MSIARSVSAMIMKNTKGMTLVEVVVTAAVSMILLGAIYTAINSAQRHSMGIERKVTAQQDVRPALELMAMEIRMASFNPNFTIGNWLVPTGSGACSTVSSNQTYLGIQEATATSITVEMDINQNCTSYNDPICMRHYSGNPNPNEVIRYNYDATNQYITRNTNCGGDQPFLGDTVASGNPRTVRVVNDMNGNGVFDAGADIPVFRYYDGSGVLIPTANLPARIPDIRRIEITLAVETEDVDPNTGQRRHLIYSTSVIPRNHAQ
jgi:type II secretory pathway pseudopilin PulG